MKQTTTPAERKQFYKLHETGKTYQEIAELFGVSSMCVRMWCRRQRDGGEVENRYYNPKAGALSQFDSRLPEKVLALRGAHPGWGSESLLLHLRKDPDLREVLLPKRSSIARFLHGFTEFRHVPKKKSA